MVIAADSFFSGNALRDKDVISGELLDASTYPTITFTSTRIRPAGDGWVVSGSITARGTASDAEMRVREARTDGSAIRFLATASRCGPDQVRADHRGRASSARP